MNNILALNLIVSNYIPISKDVYNKAYRSHNLKIQVIMHLHIIWIIACVLASILLCWYFKFDLKYCIGIALIYALIFIASHYLLNNYITKCNNTFISKHHLTSLCSNDNFHEISEQEYATLKKVIETNTFLKLKVNDIFSLRDGNIMTFDYIQLCIPKYIEYYKDMSNHKDIYHLKESLSSQLNKI
ncbi:MULTISPECIES: hypothetical protein [Acinetobacter]|uniref:hypothetical protein n=1 Tax=Acinetobacter TaxID=469 RepID=UPI002FE20D7F